MIRERIEGLPREEADQVVNLFRPTLSNLSLVAKRFLR
jgi:hypothetical protein